MSKKKKLERSESFVNTDGKDISRFNIKAEYVIEVRDMDENPLDFYFVLPTNYISVLSDVKEIYVHYK